MHPLVRDLYKKLLTVGRDYPAGLDHVRDRAKREIFEAAERDGGLFEDRRPWEPRDPLDLDDDRDGAT